MVVDPAEADRFMDMYTQKQFTGNIKARDINGQFWPLSKFKKTSEFGGSGVKPAEKGDISKMSKDAAKLKPAEIGITGKNIEASDLGSVIVNNSVLQSTEWGQAVIQMANNIMAGEPAVIPENIRKHEPLVKAIVDNAGEYLGVLALVSGQSQWYGGAATQKNFIKWLGGDLGGLTVNFPAGQTTPLADSFATVSNAATGHTLNISSKGTGGGAAGGGPGAPLTAATVGFKVMNLLYQNDPKSIPKEYKELMPWNDNVVAAALQSMKNKTPMPAKYQKVSNTVNSSSAADGGKLMYAVKRDVAKIVNAGAIPEYEAAMLEILDYNFIQQYATFEGKKSGVVNFSTQWPAKLDGEISMENKSSANEPGSGGFSFKLHPKGTPMRVDPESGDVQDKEQPMDVAPAKTSTDDLDAVAQKSSGIKANRMTPAPLGAREPIGDKQSLGRERRKR